MAAIDADRPAAPAPRGVTPVFVFFGLTFLLTAPIWMLSAASGREIMPGLPVGAFAVVCPAAAAFIIACRRGGWTGGRALLSRAADVGRFGKGWWLPILLIAPAVSVVAFLVLRLSGAAIPDPQTSIPGVLALSALFLVGAVAEELGWSGFALDPLQARWGPVAAALVIGGIWAVWHYPTLLQAHRSLLWIAWWTLGSFALRLIMVWLYNGTNRSVFAAAVFHAVSNLCWQLFPVRGSWFDPRLHGLLMTGVALVIVVGFLNQTRKPTG